MYVKESDHCLMDEVSESSKFFKIQEVRWMDKTTKKMEVGYKVKMEDYLNSNFYLGVYINKNEASQVANGVAEILNLDKPIPSLPSKLPEFEILTKYVTL